MIDLTQFWDDHPEYRNKPKEYAVYSSTYLPIGASLTGVQNDVITGVDSDFVCTNIYGIATNAAGTAYITTPYVLNLIYTAYSRNITNVKVEWSAVAGTLANARIFWPYPIVIPKATTFSTLLDNPQAATANVYIALHGFKVFY